MTTISSLLEWIPLDQISIALLLISPSIIIYVVNSGAKYLGYSTYPLFLFLGSYLPLYPVLIWQTLNQEYLIEQVTLPTVNWLSTDWSVFAVISGNLLLISVLYMGMIIYVASERAGTSLNTEVIEDVTPVANEYILVYIYPLLLLDYAKLFEIVVFLLIFSSIAIIQVRTDRYMINPILALFGFHFYRVEVDGNHVFLLSKQNLQKGDSRKISQITVSTNVRVHTGRT